MDSLLTAPRMGFINTSALNPFFKGMKLALLNLKTQKSNLTMAQFMFIYVSLKSNVFASSDTHINGLIIPMDPFQPRPWP